MPRFITDENIPSSINSWLRAKGYDVVRTVEAIHAGANDMSIIEFAQKNSMVIVTLDEDFVRLYRRIDHPLCAIVVRTHPPTPGKVQERLSSLFLEVEIEKYVDALIVVTDNDIRIDNRRG
jgi:predicted nuclease of predicted toxin-antitoxin system